MTFNFRTEEYYKRFIELQEKLRKSEEERLKLEMKFNEMVRVTREEEQIHYRKLKTQYKRFLEEDRRREDRNERIVRTLERIENRVAVLMAKTERFKLLRKQYQAFLDRVNKTSQINKSKISEIPKEMEREKPALVVDKGDIVQTYLQNLSSNKLREMLKREEDTRAKLSFMKDPSEDHNYSDLYTFGEPRPNYANSVADDIMDSIYSRRRPGDITKFKEAREFNNNVKPARKLETPPEIIYSAGFEAVNEPRNVSEIEDTETDDISESDEILYKNPIEFNKTKPKDTITAHETVNNSFDSPLSTSDKKSDEGLFKKKLEETFVPAPASINGEQSKHSPIKMKEDELTEQNYVLSATSTAPIESRNVNQANIQPIRPQGTDDKKDKKMTNEIEENLNQFEDKSFKENVLQEIKSGKVEGLIKEELKEQNEHLEKAEIQSEGKYSPIKENFETDQPQSAQEFVETEQPVITEKNFEEIPDVLVLEKEASSEPNQQEYDNSKDVSYDQYDQQPHQQYDESGQPLNYELSQHYKEDSQSIQQYDEQGQPIQSFVQPSKYDEQGQSIQHLEQKNHLVQPYDESGQSLQASEHQSQVMQQYDEHSQPTQQFEQPQSQLVQQYDEQGQLIQPFEQQYDQHGQLMQPFDQQYDEHGQPIQPFDQQYDEHGQPIQPFDQQSQLMQQYDEQGQPIQQYDEHGQLMQQYEQFIQPYDENAYNEQDGQYEQQYDESGQLIQQYENQQYDENGQLIQQYAYPEGQDQVQYDENGQLIQQSYDDQQYYNQQYENVEGASDQQANNFQLTENVVEGDVLKEKDNTEEVKKSSNVMEMLDTDTESLKQDTKISHDSDFDFSNE